MRINGCACVSIDLHTSLLNHPCIHPSIHPSLLVSTYAMLLYLLIYLYVCLSIYRSFCLCIQLWMLNLHLHLYVHMHTCTMHTGRKGRQADRQADSQTEVTDIGFVRLEKSRDGISAGLQETVFYSVFSI